MAVWRVFLGDASEWIAAGKAPAGPGEPKQS